MAATDKFVDLNQQIDAIRATHADELKAANDQLLSTQIELSLTKAALTKAIDDRAASDRVTVKFVTQFGMVANIFAEVQKMALAYESITKPVDTSKLKVGGVDVNSAFVDGGKWVSQSNGAPIAMIDGVEPPPPTHDASWQHPETEKWYDAVIFNGNIMHWQERPQQIEYEPSDETVAAIKG